MQIKKKNVKVDITTIKIVTINRSTKWLKVESEIKAIYRIYKPYTLNHVSFNVARYTFSRSIPPKFDRKLRRHKQRFGKIDTTVVLDKGENLL